MSPTAAMSPTAMRAGAMSPTGARMPGAMMPRPQKAANLDKSPANVAKLVLAAQKGEADQVQRLLSNGVDPDGMDPQGLTPLLAASGKGSVPVVQLLLDAGADPNLGNNGVTPMTVAFQKGNKKVLQTLFASAFQSLDDAVAPSHERATRAQRAASGGLGGEDDVPENALDELREVTTKLAELGKSQRGGFNTSGEWEDVLQLDSEKIREEAVKDAMLTIARAQQTGEHPREGA